MQIHSVRPAATGNSGRQRTKDLSSTDERIMKTGKQSNLPVIGWREWVRLPDLGIKKIKAKVDTGARSSSLHAFDLQQFDRNGVTWVKFKVHPEQRRSDTVVKTEARVIYFRSVRSSSGKAAIRPVILTQIELLGAIYAIEVTLANRDEMGFRMLLGREAFRKRFLVDAGGSFYAGRLDSTKRKNKK